MDDQKSEVQNGNGLMALEQNPFAAASHLDDRCLRGPRVWSQTPGFLRCVKDARWLESVLLQKLYTSSVRFFESEIMTCLSMFFFGVLFPFEDDKAKF